MKNTPDKKLLVIGYVWPEPNSSAAGARMLQLIQCFQLDGYDVTYASPAQASEHAIDYQMYHIKTANIELNNTSFDEFLAELQPNAVMFDRFMMEEQFGWRVEKTCPDALRILDTEDLHCLRFARQKLAKGNNKVIRHVDKIHLIDDHAKREIAAIYRCDLTVMISRYEMQLLENEFGVDPDILMYLPFLLKDIQNQYPAFEERMHFVSIGNFRHEPNWDAVLQLKTEIWPLIKKQLKGTAYAKAQLHVFGAYPPKKATQLNNEQQGFIVKGWCEDAFKELRKGRVLLAPLRFGAGLKGKMLDAAQCGLPAVTTSIGAEGLFEQDTHANKTCDISDDFSEFATLAAKLYSQAEKWQAYQNNCEAFLKNEFAFEPYAQLFIERLHHIEENLITYRANNFTGTMLRHHSMKSTQYMAQWIEAKNKHNTKN